MTELVIVDVPDTWVNSNRTGTIYADANGVRIKSGERYAFLLPQLPNILGATILDAYLVGHAATAIAAQTITVRPVAERWSPGRVTWTNRPDVGALTASTDIPATAAGGTVTLTGLASMLQAVADGSEWYGLRLTTTDTSNDNRFYATDSGQPAWELHIVVSETVEVAENLRPDGGLAVSSASPILAWDLAGAETWVQVDTPAAGVEPDEVAPDYDSGWQPNLEPLWDLAGRHTLVGAGPHYWRVNVRDAEGNEFGWSDWAEFTVEAMPTLVVDAPTGPIGDPAPTVLAHLTSGTIANWKVMVTGPNRADVRYRSGLQSGPVDIQIPLKSEGKRVLVEQPPGETAGWLYLQVFPEGDWAEAVGQLPFVEAWVEITFDDDVVVAPTNLIVAPIAAGHPRHRWTFNITDVPEAFLFVVDGETIARVGADDFTPDAGRYEWVDNGEIAPLQPHTLEVRAVSDGGRSEPVKVAAYSHKVDGFWVLPEDTSIDPIVLAGTAVEDFMASDAVATYTTLTGEEVDIIYGLPGRRFTFEGTVDSRQDVWATRASLKALRKSANRNAQVVWGAESIAGRIRSPHATSHGQMRPNDLLNAVRLGVVEL